jgi:hypothetical protein
LSRISTNSHLRAVEVYHLLTPLAGDSQLDYMLVRCSGSGQPGCCYPVYVRVGEEPPQSDDRTVENWEEREDGYFVMRKGGDRKN